MRRCPRYAGLDKHWKRLKDEVPHLKRLPSEYIREHFWFTTQPIDEPDQPQDLFDVMGWVGWDRLMFSTDYPHWDFDDPRYVFKTRLEEPARTKLFSGNAKAALRTGVERSAGTHDCERG